MEMGIFSRCVDFIHLLHPDDCILCDDRDEYMKSTLEQKRLDIMITAILLLLLLLAGIFRASPLDFMNPGFPILRTDELGFSEDFLLVGEPEIERATSVYDFSEVRYYLVFRMNQNVVQRPGNFKYLHGVQFLTRFSSPDEAAQALQNSYKKYLDHEENFLIQITDVPLDGFVIQVNGD